MKNKVVSCFIITLLGRAGGRRGWGGGGVRGQIHPPSMLKWGLTGTFPYFPGNKDAIVKYRHLIKINSNFDFVIASRFSQNIFVKPNFYFYT